MIHGETGEAITGDMEEMLRRQRRTSELIRKVGRLDRGELKSGFAGVREATERGHLYRIGITIVSLGLVLLLSFWALRGALRSLAQISQGLSRFATGNFGERVESVGGDVVRGVDR